MLFKIKVLLGVIVRDVLNDLTDPWHIIRQFTLLNFLAEQIA